MIEALQYGGRLTTITPTKRNIVGEFPVVKPVSNYIIIPAFSIAHNWFGVSNIRARFIYTISGHTYISITKARKPTTINFIPILSYEVSGVKIRRKLWLDNDVVIYESLYTKLRIPTVFEIEIWCKNATPLLNPSDIILKTSLLSFGTGPTQYVGAEVGTRRLCYDNTIDLAQPFFPANGDSWSFDDCGTGTLSTTPFVPPMLLNGILWLLNTTDGLYYEVKLIVDAGFAVLDCQTPSIPPVVGTDYLLLRANDGTSHKMTLQTDGGFVVPVIDQNSFPVTGLNSIELIEPVSGDYHTFSMINDTGVIVYVINQLPSPPMP